MSPPPKDKHVLLSAVYEVLVRALQETFPGAALLSVAGERGALPPYVMVDRPLKELWFA